MVRQARELAEEAREAAEQALSKIKVERSQDSAERARLVDYPETLKALERILQDQEARTRLEKLLQLVEGSKEGREAVSRSVDTQKRIPEHLFAELGKKPTVKLSLEVTPELNDTLQELVQETHASGKSDVLRKAIALMKVAVDAKRQGKRLGIAEQNQPLATEIVGLGF